MWEKVISDTPFINGKSVGSYLMKAFSPLFQFDFMKILFLISDNGSENIEQKTRMIICVCVFVCVLFISGIFTFLSGCDSAYNKKDYRIIESSQLESMKLNRESKEYAIIYKTENEYIIAEICTDMGEVEICYDKQIIIPKRGIETIYYEDYREIINE